MSCGFNLMTLTREKLNFLDNGPGAQFSPVGIGEPMPNKGKSDQNS